MLNDRGRSVSPSPVHPDVFAVPSTAGQLAGRPGRDFAEGKKILLPQGKKPSLNELLPPQVSSPRSTMPMRIAKNLVVAALLVGQVAAAGQVGAAVPPGDGGLGAAVFRSQFATPMLGREASDGPPSGMDASRLSKSKAGVKEAGVPVGLKPGIDPQMEEEKKDAIAKKKQAAVGGMPSKPVQKPLAPRPVDDITGRPYTNREI